MNRAERDSKLVRRAVGGDTDAFTEIVKLYQDAVFFLVRRTVGSDEDARETTQDVFVKVYENLGRFGGRSSFSTWLYRIACNTTLSAVRKRRHEYVGISEQRLAGIADEQVDTLFGEGGGNERLIAGLRSAIEMLAPDERLLITLFYYEERPIAECAEILALSEANAKVRLHRIRKKLYAIIKDEADER